jgi:hypothetical protein
MGMGMDVGDAGHGDAIEPRAVARLRNVDLRDESALVHMDDDVVVPSRGQECGGKAELAFGHGLVPLRRKV